MGKITLISAGLYGNIETSVNFQKHCEDEDYQGTIVAYIVPADRYFKASQSEADAAALAEANMYGQAKADQEGECIQVRFWNVPKSATRTRNNCELGYSGQQGTYTVPAHQFSSTTQEAADQLAQDYANANAQDWVNTPANGVECIADTYPFKWIVDLTSGECENGDCGIVADFNVESQSGSTAMITVIPSGGVAPYYYQWSNGATTQAVSGVSKTEEITVTITDSDNCVGIFTTTPNAAVLSGLKLEMMYFNQASLNSSEDPEYYPRKCVGGHQCNSARFEVFANTISQGIANLNNAGGQSGAPDDNNHPPEYPNYSASDPLDRYWTKTISREDAQQIAGEDGILNITLTYTGTDTPHSSASWFRIKKFDGTILYSDCVSSFTGFTFDPYA